MAKGAEEVSTMTGYLDYFVRASLTVGKLSNGARSSIAVDLDFGHYKVPDSVGDGRAGIISAFTVGSTTFFCQQKKDLLYKLGCGPYEAEEGMDVCSLSRGGCRSRG